MSLNLRHSVARRGIGLTPMIDVVFLLLVFFMLTAQFDRRVTVDLAAAGGLGSEGISRVVDIFPDAVRLNGVSVDLSTIGDELARDSAGSPIVLRSRGDADVQRLVDVVEYLQSRGLENLVLAE